ncbi:MAG TPA: hypothetical protein VGJ66_04535 [Pyrinomonadaceae bacterium]
MKRKLAYIFAVPMLFSVLAFHGNCQSQCEELRQELIKDCRDDLGLTTILSGRSEEVSRNLSR